MHPDKNSYWMFPKIDDWEAFKTRVALICKLILSTTKGEIHLISADEKTGIQALGRRIAHYKGGKRMEYEYKRNGTICLLAAFDVGRGSVVNYMLNDTRKAYSPAQRGA